MAVVRDHYVLRLEVPVDDLFLMDVLKGVAELADDLAGQPFADLSGADQIFKIPPVDPLHHDTVSYRREIDQAEILAYACMAEGKAYVEILPEQFFVEGIATIFLLQGLVNEESSVLAATVQFAEPIIRAVDEFKTIRIVVCTVLDIGQKES